MTQKSNKIAYWVLKVLSILISCAFPVFAVVEHFPIWTETHGTVKSMGSGLIIILIVVAIIFRKAVFGFIKEKLKLTTAPPLAIWITCLIISYVLLYIESFIRDLTIVFWMGLIGCAIGTLITLIAEKCFGEKEKEEGDN